MALALVASWAGLGGAGCFQQVGGPDPGSPTVRPGDSVDPSVPAQDIIKHYFCEPLGVMLCQNALNCGCAPDMPGGPAPTEPGCAARVTQRCVQERANFTAQLQSGSMGFSPRRADECLRAISDTMLPCSTSHEAILDGLCNRMVYDRASRGDSCFSVMDGVACDKGNGMCRGGMCQALPRTDEFCTKICAGDGLCIFGSCNEPSGQGESCFSDQSCAGGNRCVGGVCRGLLEAGQVCDADLQCGIGFRCLTTMGCTRMLGDPCQSNADCGREAFCEQDDASVCVPLAENGEFCQSSDECMSHLYCSVQDGMVCRPRPQANNPCGSGGECAQGLACIENLCRALPQAGQDCGAGAGATPLCADGLGCFNGTCNTLNGPGGSCTDDRRCNDSAVCVQTGPNLVCAQRVQAGGPCQQDAGCVDGLYCAEGVCTPQKEQGEACLTSSECGPSAVCELSQAGGGAGSFCVPIPGEGERCTTLCQPELVCDVAERPRQCQAEICTVIR